MPTMKEATAEFLAHKRVAVTGVSRSAKDHGSNTIFKAACTATTGSRTFQNVPARH